MIRKVGNNKKFHYFLSLPNLKWHGTVVQLVMWYRAMAKGPVAEMSQAKPALGSYAASRDDHKALERLWPNVLLALKPAIENLYASHSSRGVRDGTFGCL